MGSARWMNGDEAGLRESEGPSSQILLRSVQQSRHEGGAGWDESFMLPGQMVGP